MDIYKRIESDHATARALIKKLRKTGGTPRSRRQVFEQFKREVWVHHKLEEVVLYGALLNHPKTRKDSLGVMSEHHAVNALLDDLDRLPMSSPRWTAKLGVLMELMEHHMGEEEAGVFAEARKVVSASQAEEMGLQFDHRKRVILSALSPAR